jgi:hypothetical protein
MSANRPFPSFTFIAIKALSQLNPIDNAKQKKIIKQLTLITKNYLIDYTHTHIMVIYNCQFQLFRLDNMHDSIWTIKYYINKQVNFSICWKNTSTQSQIFLSLSHKYEVILRSVLLSRLKLNLHCRWKLERDRV